MTLVGRRADYVIMVAETAKLSHLKLNVPSLLYYFSHEFKSRKGVWYPMNTVNWMTLGRRIKTGILDYMILNGWDVEAMKTFVKWVFDTKPDTKWLPAFLPAMFGEWVARSGHGVASAKLVDKNEVAARRAEERQFVEYLGEGYNDEHLTMTQFWLGLDWRRKNLSQAEQGLIQGRYARLSPEVRDKLWYWEQYMPDNLDARRLFAIELARYSGSPTVGAACDYYHREGLKLSFSEEELLTEALDSLPYVR